MPVPLTPIRCLKRAADLFGGETGIICGERSFTYRQFSERCRRLGGALADHLRPGDRAAYLSFNTHRLLEGYFGVLLARGVVMPLNVRLSTQELIAILQHSGARVLFYETDFAPLAETLRQNCRVIERYIPLDESYDELIDASTPLPIEFMDVDEHSTAELFYTSGSTGTPKGVELSHRTLYLHAIDLAGSFPACDHAVDLHTIPLFHANGWGRPQVSTMLGMKQVMVRRFDPATVCGLVEQHRATYMCLVPTMVNALLNFPDLQRFDLSSLEQIMVGGAASSPELIERAEKAMGCEVTAGYGLTETAPVITRASWKLGVEYADDADRYRRQAMAGWPVLGTEVHVVDPDGNRVPQDMTSIGEVVVRSDHVTSGYYRDEAATAAVVRDGWFYTGDMAVWDEHNYIHIVDRKKEIIISGGENISSIEVEKAIFSHPGVFECAVVAAPDEKWGEVPAAIVVRKPGAELTAEQLVEHISGRLGRFKIPRIVEFSDEPLPKTGTGKIRKLVLREKYWVGKEKRVQG